MEKNFIEFNGNLINTRYIKRIFKTEHLYNMERLLFIALFLIILVLVMICYVLIDLHNNLKQINTTIIDIHPNYKYKNYMKAKDIKLKYFNPLYWIKRRKNREIYAIILAAKYRYISKYNAGYVQGLCLSFQKVFEELYGYTPKYEIKKLIPELNRKFFNIQHSYPFYWDLNDYSSRINAFNKLLECYKNKI